MKKLLSFSIILNVVLLIVAVYGFDDEIYTSYVNLRTNNIVMFGDSITKKAGRWEFLLNRTDVVNSGFGGFTSGHLRLVFNRSVARYKPKVCFLMIGINDINVGVPLEKTCENIQWLTNEMQKTGIIPVIQFTTYVIDRPGRNALVANLNRFISEFALAEKIKTIDINQSIAPSGILSDKFSTDGTHINHAAYLIWTKAVQKTLAEIGI